MDAIERIYQRVAEKTGNMTYVQKKRLRARQYYYDHREEILQRDREARARGEGKKKYMRHRRTSVICSRMYYYEHREEILRKRHLEYIEKQKRKQEA